MDAQLGGILRSGAELWKSLTLGVQLRKLVRELRPTQIRTEMEE